MSKLTKAQAKAHAEACRTLKQNRLSEDERWFVLENWQESAQYVNSAAIGRRPNRPGERQAPRADHARR